MHLKWYTSPGFVNSKDFFCVSPNRESLCVLLCVLLCGLMWDLSPQLRTVPSCREALKDHGVGIPGDFSRVSSCDAMKKPSAMISEIGDRFFEPPQRGNSKSWPWFTRSGFWCSFHCVPSLSSTSYSDPWCFPLIGMMIWPAAVDTLDLPQSLLWVSSSLVYNGLQYYVYIYIYILFL